MSLINKININNNNNYIITYRVAAEQQLSAVTDDLLQRQHAGGADDEMIDMDMEYTLVEAANDSERSAAGHVQQQQQQQQGARGRPANSGRGQRVSAFVVACCNVIDKYDFIFPLLCFSRFSIDLMEKENIFSENLAFARNSVHSICEKTYYICTE